MFKFLRILVRFALFLFTFSGIFAENFVNFVKISSKYVKIVTNSLVDFIFKDKKLLLTFLIL